MGSSLFDQLQKSGLVDEKKAKKAKQVQYKSKKQKQKVKKGAAAQLDEAKLRAQQAHTAKVERDRQLNLQKKMMQEQKAIAAQIRQLIVTNRVKDRDGEIAYHFTDANVVKDIHVSEQVYQHITSGRLAIARLGESYELVPKAVAEKIIQRDSQCIIRLERKAEAKQDEDDPYADFTIPDDLMW